MDQIDILQIFKGDGSRVERGVEVPLFEKNRDIDSPEHYVADEGLRQAMNVALALGQPLLVTGEPGTGKTQLAYRLAYELKLPDAGNPAPLVFHTKTTSTAKDLFYRYDALAHFHHVQLSSKRAENSPHPVDVASTRDGGAGAGPYISYEALGKAILLSMRGDDPNRELFEELRGKEPRRSVVLVDEIDKAPRDLPNDVLNEIENMTFTVKETDRSFSADPRYKPIMILTSNSEKNLPDAFLRRCVFYHIPFPKANELRKIVEKRLKPRPESADLVTHAIEHFEEIRRLALRKNPATAELLAWVDVLLKKRFDVRKAADLSQEEKVALAFTYSILAKSKEDRERLKGSLGLKPDE